MICGTVPYAGSETAKGPLAAGKLADLIVVYRGCVISLVGC
ncbi:hypothetical protein [Sporomusa termitida]|nr:hypothetical protein [Sporomusa termitida]